MFKLDWAVEVTDCKNFFQYTERLEVLHQKNNDFSVLVVAEKGRNHMKVPHENYKNNWVSMDKAHFLHSYLCYKELEEVLLFLPTFYALDKK